MTSNDNQLDELFRKGLGFASPEQVDEDWALMKARLMEQEGKRKNRGFLWLFSSAAALLLMSAAVFFYSPGEGEPALVRNDAADSKNDLTIGNEQANGTAADPVVEQEVTDGVPENSSLANRLIAFIPEIVSSKSDISLTETKGDFSADRSDAADTVVSADTPVLAAEVQEAVSEDAVAVTAAVGRPNEDLVAEAQKPELSEENKERNTVKKSRFALALNVSPDLSGVDRFERRKMGYSLGAGVHYAVSKKISLESEVAFTQKRYETGFSHFRGPQTFFAVRPINMSAGFEVLDLQLNMAYTLFTKGKYSLGLAGGFSSYLMLDEEYSFNYQNENAHGLQGFSTGYQNNHFLGVANVGLRLRRNISADTRLSINPYLKLPLTELGYGNVRLRSAGVQVGLVTGLKTPGKK